MAKKSSIAFVDYYSSIGRIPTRQNIDDFEVHRQRRIALYIQMGLPPAMVEGKDVIELGPGSGHNAIITASLKPGSYTLLDGNPASLESTESLLGKFFPGNSFKYVKADMTKYTAHTGFDIVICEGVIPGQDEPVKFLKTVAKMVRPGGIIIITCSDATSIFPEILRRVQGQVLTQNIHNLEEQISVLEKFFTPQLKNMKNMSRKYEDWVIDQIIHPWQGVFISIADAINGLKGEFITAGCSPRFLTDWRWYKDVKGPGFLDATNVLDSYYSNAHTLLDYRFVERAIDPKIYVKIERLCFEIYKLEKKMHDAHAPVGLDKLTRKLAELGNLMKKTNPRTMPAFAEIYKAFKAGKPAQGSFREFGKWWGRGQQYVSFVRV